MPKALYSTSLQHGGFSDHLAAGEKELKEKLSTEANEPYVIKFKLEKGRVWDSYAN